MILKVRKVCMLELGQRIYMKNICKLLTDDLDEIIEEESK